MNEKILINKHFIGAQGKNSSYDLCITHSSSNSIIVFMHGYMGFKDWGCWNLVQDFFTSKGHNFAKFNVSHNGTSTSSPTDFVDLDAFANNSYWKELCDLELFLEHLKTNYGFQKVHLIGHSRAGGIVLLSNKNPLVQSITTWASISNIEKRMLQGEQRQTWKNDGVYFVTNGRTQQSMPHSYIQYEEFRSHENQLNIENACRSCEKPLCIIHGENDTSVKIEESEQISRWTTTNLNKISEANHTFQSSEPWTKKLLPSQLLEICTITENFITNNKE